MKRSYHYKNIGLLSRQISSLHSRNDVDTSIIFDGHKLNTPIIASPMPDVCDGKMAKTLYSLGAFGIIHRFNTIEKQLQEYKISGGECGCAIGVNGDFHERYKMLFEAGCRCFCIDVANGASLRVESVVNKIKNSFIIAGNVATKECYRWLTQLPIHAIRVGISGGSVCSTKSETGLNYPMASSILECAQEKTDNILLIADGAIKEPSDLCKAIVLGADICMVGGILAGTEESPAQVMKINEKLFKTYKGAASFSTQKQVGKNPEYVEGTETLIPYVGPVEKIIKRFRNGLRSSMSYMNAHNLNEYKNNADWTIIE